MVPQGDGDSRRRNSHQDARTQRLWTERKSPANDCRIDLIKAVGVNLTSDSSTNPVHNLCVLAPLADVALAKSAWREFFRLGVGCLCAKHQACRWYSVEAICADFGIRKSTYIHIRPRHLASRLDRNHSLDCAQIVAQSFQRQSISTMSGIALLMQVKMKRREIGVITVVTQSVVLLFAHPSSYLDGWIGLLISGLVSIPLVANFDRRTHRLGTFEKAIVTTGVGGLGMALGSIVCPSPYVGRCGALFAIQPFLNGATLLMVCFCLIGCRLCTQSCDRRIFASFFETGSCLAAMIAGMLLGEILFGSLFLNWCGQVVGPHWAMTTGMLVGNLFGIGAWNSWTKRKHCSDFRLIKHEHLHSSEYRKLHG
jgi:hypothetical protein